MPTNTLTTNPKMDAVRQSVQQSYAEIEGFIETQLSKLPTAKLYQAPAPNEWSLMQILAHIVEIMTYWGGEIEKLVAQPGQNFGRVQTDTGRLGYISDHQNDTLTQVQAALPLSYARLQKVLNNLTDSDLALTGLHSRFGERPLEWFMAEFVTDHLKNHLTQMQECLVAIE